MLWVAIFGGIALVGLVGFVWYALRLWRKASAVLHEAGAVSSQLGQVADLLSQVEISSPSPGPPPGSDQSTRIHFAPDPGAEEDDEDEVVKRFHGGSRSEEQRRESDVN